MYFSSNQLDQLATILENKSGDTRFAGEASEERICTSLEKLGNTAPVTGESYAKRVLNAVNNIDLSGGSQSVYVDREEFGTVSEVLSSQFNGQVEVNPEATSWESMFAYLKSFNQPVTIPSGVEVIDGLFYSSGFNQPFTLPATVSPERAQSIFMDSAFNSTLTIEDGVTSCAGVFAGATSFNQPVTIPDSVTDCYAMFNMATAFKQDIVFPANCNNLRYVFDYSNYYGNVYVLNSIPNLDRMFANCNNEFEKTLYLVNQSIGINFVATEMISTQNWQTVDNGYYNAYYNIRVLYNMPEEYL